MASTLGPRSPNLKVVRGLAVGDGEALGFAEAFADGLAEGLGDGLAEGFGDGVGAFVVLGALVVGEGVVDAGLCDTEGAGLDAVALVEGAAVDTDGDGVSAWTGGGPALVVGCGGAAASEDHDASRPAHPPRMSAPARARAGVASRTLRGPGISETPDVSNPPTVPSSLTRGRRGRIEV